MTFRSVQTTVQGSKVGKTIHGGRGLPYSFRWVYRLIPGDAPLSLIQSTDFTTFDLRSSPIGSSLKDPWKLVKIRSEPLVFKTILETPDVLCSNPPSRVTLLSDHPQYGGSQNWTRREPVPLIFHRVSFKPFPPL